ncbi:MAG: hypothetical protein ACR2PM_11655, partial [Hyphomicrobiales bacterium]
MLSKHLLAAVSLAVSGHAALPGGLDEGPVKLEATSVSFARFLPGTTRFGALEWRGGIEIESDHDAFGGYSGLVLSRDGTKLISVSDRGWWFTA